MKCNIWIFCLLSLVFLNSCLSLTTLQSGRTLGAGNGEVGIHYVDAKYSQMSFTDSKEDDYKPVIGLKLQVGANENFDFGFSVDHTSLLSGNIKYQFLGSKTSLFAVSGGFEAGFNVGIFLFGLMKSYMTLPLYSSFHPHKYIALYYSPRYIFASDYLFASESNNPLGLRGSTNIFGNSYGLAFGNRHKILFEIQHFDKVIMEPTGFAIGYKMQF